MKNKYKIFFDKIIIILKATYTFKKPKNKKILIFDNKGFTASHYRYFSNLDVEILHVLGEKVNFFIIFKILLNFKFPTIKLYIEEYIKIVKPSFIFHNSFNVRFFEIDKKKFNFEFVKIFTQSELKNFYDFKDFVSGKKNLKCDYLFLWSEGIKNKFSNYIKGNYVVVGSFANNDGPRIENKKLKKELIYISQYRTFKKKKITDTKKTIRDEFHGTRFSWDQFFKVELDLSEMLKNYCKINNIKFLIVGTSINDYKSEKEFFSKRLGNKGWKYIKSLKNKRGIYLTNKAKFIVTVDSTLGYECLGRGQRVGFFSMRNKYIHSSYSRFGWTMNLKKEGPCWTTNNNTNDFYRVINFLVKAKENEWEKLRENVLNDLMFYDPGNKIYLNYLKKFKII